MKKKNGKRRILLVDDHPVLRKGLAELLDQEVDLHVCAEAADAHEARQAIETHTPDLAIVDLSLKNSSGLDLIKDIRIRFPEVPVLVLSMHDEELYAQRVLRAGAKGYVMKQEAMNEMLTAVRRVLEGKIYLSSRMAEQVLEQTAGRDRAARGPVSNLSDRELEVFELLGRGLGTSTIARQLRLSVKTVETHRAKIKEKLGIKNAPQLVERAVHWVRGL